MDPALDFQVFTQGGQSCSAPKSMWTSMGRQPEPLEMRMMREDISIRS